MIKAPNPEIFGLQNVIIRSALPFVFVPQGEIPDAPIGVGALGNPVYSDIEFLEGEWTDSTGKTYEHGNLKLQTVIMMISQAKRIVRTEIQGKDGSVKEYIGMDDYLVQISGVIDGANGVYPIDDVATLKGILTAPKSIEVVSWYLQQFDIDNLTITDFNIPQIPGGYSSQPFTISGLSDKPIYALIQSA